MIEKIREREKDTKNTKSIFDAVPYPICRAVLLEALACKHVDRRLLQSKPGHEITVTLS